MKFVTKFPLQIQIVLMEPWVDRRLHAIVAKMGTT